MFCQKSTKDDLYEVTTFPVSDKIMELAKKDVVLRVRLADVNDCISSEVKYHLKCKVQFERRASKSAAAVPDITDNCMDRICASLAYGLTAGHVYNMGDVWSTYVKLCEDNGKSIPRMYVSRRKPFYDAVQQCLGDKASFVRPLDMQASLLLYPSDRSGYMISKALTEIVDKEESEMDDDFIPTMCSPDTMLLQEIVHAALQIRKDLDEKAGHTSTWRGIDQEHVNKTIPQNLYLFLRVVAGGLSALDSDDLAEEDKETMTCSIAQDIAFLASGQRKLTPKHVGLVVALHQATRSKELVNLFHAAGHTIGYETIRRIDTSIADEILDRYDSYGAVFIPDCIVAYGPGRLILCTCDNIDVLEETLDGKCTFHCSQMVLWQRGPPAKRNDNRKVIGRPKALEKDRLEMLHKLDQCNISSSSRPKPIISGTASEAEVDNWLLVPEERIKSNTLDHAWLLARMHATSQQSVPPRAAFNEAISACSLFP